jgi:hypothetical protein
MTVPTRSHSQKYNCFLSTTDLQRSRCKGWFLWPTPYTYIHNCLFWWYEMLVWLSRYNKKFWEEPVAYFPLIQHGPHRKTTSPKISRSHGNVFTESLPSNGRETRRQTHRPSSDTKWTAYKITCPTILLFFVIVAVVTCLPTHCLEPKGGIHIQTHRLKGKIDEAHHWDWLKCHDTYTKFHKDWFRHSKFIVGTQQIHRQEGDHISVLWERRLKHLL